MFSGISIPAEQPTFSLESAFILIGAVAVACCVLVPEAGLVVVIACLALWFLALVGDALQGRIDGILLCWAAAFPLVPYFLSFPREHSIVTLDRVVIFVAILGIYLAKPGTAVKVPKTLGHVGLAWLTFIVIACVGLGKSPNVLNSAKILLDGFLLPILLGWCVIARFDVRQRLPTIHTAVCTASIISATVAAAEIVTGQDLLAIGDPIIPSGGFIRPNGPFGTNDTLALIGTVSLFFLLFLRTALGPKLSNGRRMLHFIGLAAAVGMSLMPMFRSVAITLLLVLIIDTLWEQKPTRRAWRIGLMVASTGVIFLLPVLAPEVFEDRSRAENAYARVAEYAQSFRVFLDHPMIGVGFLNFNRYVTGEPRYVASYRGVTSVDTPHSNLAQVLTETGILGFVPYLMAYVLLLRAMWQLRQLNGSGRLVWKYSLYMFLAYWITGIAEGSGYSPLNLWYAFSIAIFCKFVLTEPGLMQSAEARVYPETFTVPARVF
jgi:O-antigen ligase